METFRVNEVAMIVDSQSTHMNGREVTVVGPLQDYTLSSGGFQRRVRCYPVKLDGEDVIRGVVPENLTKLPNKNIVVEWGNIEHIFKPDRSNK